MLPCSVMHLSTWQTHRVLVGTCSQLRLNYKTSWTTRNPAKPQPEDWSAAVWQENYCWVELLPQCLSWWLKWPSLSGSILLNCISCTTQPANHSGMPLGILALAVFSQLQYCSPGLFSVISVGGLSFPREIVNNRAQCITTGRYEMLLNPSITRVLFLWRGKEREEVIRLVIHFHQRLLRILLLLMSTVFRSPE